MQLGLIGYPIAHSLSPWIHHRLLTMHGIEGEYSLYECNPEQFPDQMEQLKGSKINGFNVTVPYKEKIIPYLDELDEAAKFLGAVNTVKSDNGRLIGYNTDGRGYAASLLNQYDDALKSSDKVLILGSGGAARGIFYALLKHGVKKINVANRTVEKAQRVIEDLQAHSTSSALTLQQAEEDLSQYDLIIQTTSVGMAPEKNRTLISLTGINANTIVSDIVYRPKKTSLLKEAERQGARLHYGHGMLLNQAILAFEIWSGKSTAASRIMTAFEEKLKGE
ncbi:shikimate dehydrogenase [Halobacillus naozhouensis]|uniref:Shikimate dehydrogenase (NADP(+)) n=1 Tax=Halobacillus naozhouensis TaxID=554880 RepID=A0ABY8ITH2_9BACI|nr:shikimate dehydrogenase [Halobacillus naozhouensis]WFT73320.1 shikimate dehydrogenase [Halobacillus naozhouensis]